MFCRSNAHFMRKLVYRSLENLNFHHGRSFSTSLVRKLPTIYCTTNLKDHEIPDGFEQRFSDVINETLDKKDVGSAVVVTTNSRLCVRDSSSPACVVEFKVFDRFNANSCPKYTPVFRDFITSELKLTDDRIYMLYTSLEKWQIGKRQN